MIFLIGCSIFVKECPKGFSNKGNQYANTTKEANPLEGLAEDTALVQFVALHEDLLTEAMLWPSFGARHTYCSEAAKYLNETVRSVYHSRSGVFEVKKQ